MLASLERLTGRAILSQWLQHSPQSWRSFPRPMDDPWVVVDGRDPLRVLVLGGGLAVGWCVRSHADGLPGALARRLAAGTGRGVIVTVVTGREMSADEARRALADVPVERFDAVLCLVGATETLELMAPRRWRASLDRLLTALDEATAADAPVLLAAPVRFEDVDDVPSRARKVAARQGAMVRATLQAAANERMSVRYLDAGGPTEIPALEEAPAFYDRWTAPFAGSLAADLARCEVVDPESPERQRALAELGVLDRAADPELVLLTDAVRDRFGATAALVNLVGDRQVTIAGFDQADVQLDESICARTVRADGPLVISDLVADGRFSTASWADSVLAPKFYAGHPLEDREGRRIGALCIVGAEPRELGDDELSLLAEFAHRAQSLLWAAAPTRSA